MGKGNRIGKDVDGFFRFLLVFFVFALLFLLGLFEDLGPRRAIDSNHRNVAVFAAEHAEEQPFAVGRETRRAVLGGVVVVGQIDQVRAVAIYETEVVGPVLIVHEGNALAIGGKRGVFGAQPGADAALLVRGQIVDIEVVKAALVADKDDLLPVGGPATPRIYPAFELGLFLRLEIVDLEGRDREVLLFAGQVGQFFAVRRQRGMVFEHPLVDLVQRHALKETPRTDFGFEAAVVLGQEGDPIRVKLVGGNAQHPANGRIEAHRADLMRQLIYLFSAVLLMDVHHHCVALIVHELAVELARAVPDRPHLLPRKQIVFQRCHPQQHVAVRIPGVVAEFVRPVLGDALGPAARGVEMVQRELKRNVRIGVEARDRKQRKLEGPFLARLVERHDVGQLVRDHVFDPIVTAAQLKVEASGPDGHSIAVVVGPAVA